MKQNRMAAYFWEPCIYKILSYIQKEEYMYCKLLLFLFIELGIIYSFSVSISITLPLLFGFKLKN